MFKDLLNSFAFGDEELRESSGFKLQTLTFTLTHELHDWLLNSSFSVTPRRLADEHRYDYSPHFTLSVVWRPMQSIKTTVEDKYGDFVLNPKAGTASK